MEQKQGYGYGAKVSRRDFLTYSALGAMGGLLSACQGVGPSGSQPTPTATTGLQPTATTLPNLSESDWMQLGRELEGRLIRSGNQEYGRARQLFSFRFDNVEPAAIVYCTSPQDVQKGIAFAQRFGLPLVARSGGHSYAGYSTTTGIILDVTPMNQVAMADGTATIGAGAHLIDVYAALTQQGMILPAGSCATVGVAGLTLGGGVGVLGRKYGLTCDNLLSAQVVLADGRIVTCNQQQEADLFWALRGGGGGNFGVVTSFTFRIHALREVTLFTLRWSWANAVSVIDAWQNWAPFAPDELWSNCVLIAPTQKGNEPIVQVNGVFVGGVTAMEEHLSALSSRIGVPPSSRYVELSSVLDAMLYEAGCYGKSVAECRLPPQGQLRRDASSVKSDYFTKVLPRQGIQALVSAIESRYSSATLGDGGIGLDAYGGAINRVRVDETAFSHRDALFSAQYSGSWTADDNDGVIRANQSWLNESWGTMRSYASGGSYQNYVDPDLSNWQQAYYGANLPRLQRIKAKYDPDNFFHFGQSISPVRP